MDPSQAHLRVPTSKSRSRPRSSRHSSTTSVPYLPQGPESLYLPEGAVSEETVELLHEFVVPPHREPRRVDTEATAVEEEAEGEDDGDEEPDDDGLAEELEANKQKPWYRRTSPWWVIAMLPISSMAMTSAAAPRVAIYTELACREHKPEYTVGRRLAHLDALSGVSRSHYHEIAPADTVNRSVPYGLDVLAESSVYLQPFFLEDSASRNETEDLPNNECAADPVVQAATAKLIAAMTTTMGILSCLTAAWWGSLSDRFGRTFVLSISTIGFLFTDFNFIIVYFFSNRLPGGYWFLLLGPFIEGILGGFTCAVAAIHAYVADSVDPANRSRIFSLSLGLMMIGMSLGPTVGGLIIRATHQTIAVFYFATAIHIWYAFMVWFVMPESLPRALMRTNRRRREEEIARARTEREAVAGDARGLRTAMRLKSAFAFLSPLTVFAPVPMENTASGSPLKAGKKDWSLSFLAACYGCSTLILSSYQYKFQYAQATFGWSSEELGYWLTLVGASRAFYLTLVLPVIIKIFNKPPVQLPVKPDEPLITSNASSSETTTESTPLLSSPSLSRATSTQEPLNAKAKAKAKEPASPKLPPHTPRFDLALARWSAALEVVCFTAIPLAPSALTFTLFGMLGSWGGGFNPAVQSLAIELYTDRARRAGHVGAVETGRLFGALGVVSAICSQVVGPVLFGLTYMKTVATYPKTIFFVSAGAITLAFIFISLVKLPTHVPSDDVEGALPHGVQREDTLVGEPEDAEGWRRRKNVKPLVATEV